MQTHDKTVIPTALHPPNVWEHLLMMFMSFSNVHTWKSFSITSLIKITSLLSFLCRKSNRELAFPATLLKRNNGEISVLVHRKPTYTGQYLHYSSDYQTSCEKSVVSSLFNRACSIIINKDDYKTSVKGELISKKQY